MSAIARSAASGPPEGDEAQGAVLVHARRRLRDGELVEHLERARVHRVVVETQRLGEPVARPAPVMRTPQQRRG